MLQESRSWYPYLVLYSIDMPDSIVYLVETIGNLRKLRNRFLAGFLWVPISIEIAALLSVVNSLSIPISIGLLECLRVIPSITITSKCICVRAYIWYSMLQSLVRYTWWQLSYETDRVGTCFPPVSRKQIMYFTMRPSKNHFSLSTYY